MVAVNSLTKIVKENQRMIAALKARQPVALQSFKPYIYSETVNVPEPTTASGYLAIYSLKVTFTAQNSASPCLNVSVSAAPTSLEPTDLEYYAVCKRNNGPALRRELQSSTGQVVWVSDINYVAADVMVQVIASEPGTLNIEVVEQTTKTTSTEE